jgi:uncharacterized protein with von Willebrand factor type A (vWA) domain
MDERIAKFIAALRGGGIRVSLAESADAFRAVDELGATDRELFRLSLRSTLVKDATDLATFDELFPLFFSTADVPPLMNLAEEFTPEEAEMLAEALRQTAKRLRDMLERMIRGEPLTPQELEQLGQMVGLNRADNLRQKEWMARRMAQALKFKHVQDALEKVQELLAQMGMSKQRLDQMRQILQFNQQALMEQLRQHAGQKIAENMAENRPHEHVDALMNRPFSALSDGDMDVLRAQVRRLAAVLRSRVALRQKRAKTGQLDAKATIRANLKHGNVPIMIKHRDRTLKPKLVVICDISTSMRAVSELMLSLIYALQDQISKTHAFAFIDRLEYVSPDFLGKEAREAVGDVLQRMPSGYYNTDLGGSLAEFMHDYLNTVDSRTTFIIVGDARNNYHDPRLDLFSSVSRRTRQTIWINPEPPMLWSTGDSDMDKYASYCDAILHVNTLAELAAAVDKLLVSH